MIDCIFCKLVAGEIPAFKVLENDQAIVFLDVHPVRPGHLLIIPKDHHKNMVETPEELVGQLFILARKIMPELQAAMAADFVVVNVVGMDVPHFHIHLIPRNFNDGLPRWPTSDYGEGEADAVAAKIKQALGIGI